MMYDQTALNCMIKYQEEVLRQYKTLTEMNNLMSYSTQQDQFSAQFPQARSNQSLLNPTQLVQAFSQMANSGQNPLLVNQVNQSVSNLKPNLLKKVSEQCNLPRTIPSSTTLNSTTITPVAKPTNYVQTAHSVDTFRKATTAINPLKIKNVVPSSSSPIELLKKPATITSMPKSASSLSILKSTQGLSNTTYTTANFGKNVQSTSLKYGNLHSAKPTETITINLPSSDATNLSVSQVFLSA